tara:strand:- start:5441 stop:6067 length:627 start_codon:yes stop_codon:yes gene_type:complete
MANEITRLLPFRQYDDNDVINFYSLDTITGEAGSVVRVSEADLDKQPVEYTSRGDSDSFVEQQGNALSLYPQVPYKVTKVSTTGAAIHPLGILLRDVRAKDENGENLLYYPEKKEELQCVVSGEAVPIATKGIFTINVRGLAGGVIPEINDVAQPSANGTVTGVTTTVANHHTHKAHGIGKFIGTGTRESLSSTDAFAGNYAILKLEC